MSKTITVTLPDGYEESTHVVIVAPERVRINSGRTVEEWAATVLALPSGEVIEEFGCDTSLNRLMTDAARVVLTGTAEKS